jgi:hypothetical protein
MQHQETELSFLFTVNEVSLIRHALGAMPHDEVRPVLEKIYSVVADHLFGEEDSSDEFEQHEFSLHKYRYGVKKDGTPKKRPGRAPKEA